MKNLMIIFVLLTISCGSQSNQADQNDEAVAKRVSLEEFKVLIADQNMQLVDVRTANEYANGFIGEAQNIDFMSDDFLNRCEAELDKTKPIAIYCAAGGRSAKALNMLKESGFKKIYELGVGYNGYR